MTRGHGSLDILLFVALIIASDRRVLMPRFFSAKA
jgi:hypothetical protein